VPLGVLREEVDLAPLSVLREEVLERLLGCVGGAVRREDDVLQLVGDGSIDPEDDVDVGGVPCRIRKVRCGLFFNVISGVVLGENKEEKTLPLVVVANHSVELELDIPSDVYAIRGGRRGEKLN
jgi:hypothetical protein